MATVTQLPGPHQWASSVEGARQEKLCGGGEHPSFGTCTGGLNSGRWKLPAKSRHNSRRKRGL